MNQRTLFDDPPNPVCHRHDPASSRTAAERVTRSGQRQRNADLVADLVRRYSGRTAIELWTLACDETRAVLKEPQEVRRRMCDLQAVGRVVPGEQRLCSVRGTLMITWTLTESERQR